MFANFAPLRLCEPKQTLMETELKLAVLIDGDNIPSAYIKEMMEEIAKYGNPTIKRIYGDWTRAAS
jgi:hypothetical protein